MAEARVPNAQADPGPRIPVTVLGATGVVGQRLVRRLARHPRFRIAHLCASEGKRGLPYAEACAWRLGGEPWAGEGERPLSAPSPEEALAPVVLSALDTAAARELEPRFAQAGALVFSNAAAFRMEPDVPLLVPEINPGHLVLLDLQRARRGWTGGIVCNPNCTTTVLALALAPLHQAFGVEKVLMTSLQAISGAGYPGLSALDLLGNTLPHIPGEEAKVEEELPKLLGTAEAPADLRVSALCNRVPVADGHSESVSVQLRGDPAPEDAVAVLEAWRGSTVVQSGSARVPFLPSAPDRPLRLHRAPDRPQVRLDLEDQDMAVHVGRIRSCPVLGLKFSLLGHNAERGAAGGALLNAELAQALGLLEAGGRP